jgi:16S rRNA (uracil1498-N3)-methyltransferase
VALPPSEAAHARARRLRPGDGVLLVDGTGAQAEADLTSAGKGLGALVTARTDAPPEPFDIWLGVAAVRGERLAWIAEKAGELGVSTLVLVRSERTQAERASDAVLERVERLVREAAKQSGAARWPVCRGPLSFAEALSDAPRPSASTSARLFVDFSGRTFPARLSERSCALLVGPEGGWTDGERDAAGASGWASVALPAATLRTETAVVASLALARAAMLRRS